MVLNAKSKLIRSPNSHTHYLTVPAAMVRDSQYPFRDGEEVELVVVPNLRKIEIRSAKEIVQIKAKEVIH